MSRKKDESRADVYARITERIVADLEKGVRPWVQPWSTGNATGRITRPLRHNGEPYTGMRSEPSHICTAFSRTPKARRRRHDASCPVSRGGGHTSSPVCLRVLPRLGRAFHNACAIAVWRLRRSQAAFESKRSRLAIERFAETVRNCVMVRSLAIAPPKMINGMDAGRRGCVRMTSTSAGASSIAAATATDAPRLLTAAVSLRGNARHQTGLLRKPRLDARAHCLVNRTAGAPVFIPCVFATGTPICILDKGWSNRRPIPLRGLSILSPQRPSQLSSPGAARHSSRFKKAAPGRPPLCSGPSGAGRSPPVSRQPSRSR